MWSLMPKYKTFLFYFSWANREIFRYIQVLVNHCVLCVEKGLLCLLIADGCNIFNSYQPFFLFADRRRGLRMVLAKQRTLIPSH